MSEWISVKDRLPEDDTTVKIKMRILFIPTKSKNITALYFKKYFNRRGENVTNWVTHWMPVENAERE